MNYLLLLLSITFFTSNSFQKGYFCLPVVDLVDAPFKSGDKKSIKKLYEMISLSPGNGKQSCLRLHQGIFNEEVVILDEYCDQVQIELQNCFYLPIPHAEPVPARFWTHKDSILSEQFLHDQKISLDLFPPPLSFKQRNNVREDSVTLVLPWHDEQTQRIYSVGTRFKIVDSHEDNYEIIFYCSHLKRSVTTFITKKYVIAKNLQDPHELRKAFTELLYAWSSQMKGSIPFVWGGTSFTYANNTQAHMHHKDFLTFWHNYLLERPYCGFDSAGLILRATQLLGIPYYCINSSTVAHSLLLVENFDALEEGDIVWAPGYLAIVANIERNELIEAQGYDRGYGAVHAIALNDRFANCSTWKKFFYLLNNKMPLLSLNSNKEIVQTVSYFKIFKLPL